MISGAAKLQVRTADQAYNGVTVVGFDGRRNVTLLKIERPGSTAVTASSLPLASGPIYAALRLLLLA